MLWRSMPKRGYPGHHALTARLTPGSYQVESLQHSTIQYSRYGVTGWRNVHFVSNFPVGATKSCNGTLYL